MRSKMKLILSMFFAVSVIIVKAQVSIVNLQLMPYNVTPDGNAGGIWMAGSAPATDGTSLFLTTGNGSVGSTNNAGNINHTLRNLLGYIELSFYPNIQAIATQISMMRDKNEAEELQAVLSNFVLKTEGYNPDFIEKFQSILN